MPWEKEIVGHFNLCYEIFMNRDFILPERRIYTVSQLTEQIKEVLEETYPFVWISGEIADFRTPVSGHYYFTLRDPGAQISAVMFRGQNRHLKFSPEDGMAVIAMGRLNVYEPKGIYQVIVEYLEPEGIGILQLAFEQLKAKLSEEGLFHDKHKRPLPFLTRKIGIVTSPTGAVIRDIMNVVRRRFPNTTLEIAPARVQGDNAAEEIAQALEILNDRGDADVIVLARGGGSLEDLQAFNSEKVARAIFASHIPVVSAIGHETDFTIADFVADVRAPTPSAAAELIVPEKEDLLRRMTELTAALKSSILLRFQLLRERIAQLSGRLIDPGRQLEDYRLRLDDALGMMLRGFTRQLEDRQNRLQVMEERLARCSPQFVVREANISLKHKHQSYLITMQYFVESRRAMFTAAMAKLHALSPLAILERGYSMTRALPDYTLVKDVQQVNMGQHVEVTLSKGAMVCRIERKIQNG